MAQHQNDLIAQAQEGDAGAFAVLYETHSPSVCRFLRSRLDGSQEAAEDVTAAVFLKVWQKLNLYVDRGLPFESWIFQVTRNCLIDYLRRQPRFATNSLELAAEVPNRNSGGEYRQVLDRQVLEAALLHLGAEQRQTVQLRFLDGLSSLETGVVMGRSDAAVKKLQARALVNLRRLLSTPRATIGTRRGVLAVA